MLQGPQPHLWRSGPSEYLHVRYRPWVNQRNQARWRGESYQLTFDQYCELWKDHWHNRGRHAEQYCMWRADDRLAWTVANVRITTRSVQLAIAGYRNARAKGQKIHCSVPYVDQAVII